MASLNKVALIGNVGRDLEVRYMPSGDAMVNIAIATSETWKDKATGEKRESTEWHRVSIFGKLAEIAGQYLKKGSSVYLEGKLKTRKYTDKDGIERYATEIVADTMQMLGGKDGGSADDGAKNYGAARTGKGHQPSPAAHRPNAPASSGGASYDDEIPFAPMGHGRSFHAI